MRALFILFVLASFYSFGQEKITDFLLSEDKKEELKPIGMIGDYFYTITPDLSISRVSASRELSNFYLIPDARNRLYDAIIVKNQLYFYDAKIDSGRVTIHKLNISDASSEVLFTIQDARGIIKNGESLYITLEKGLKRIDLSQEFIVPVTILPDFKIEGDVKAFSVFVMKDSTGIQLKGASFFDDEHNIHHIDVGYSGNLYGKDYGDFVLFSFRFNSFEHYYFDKKTGEFKKIIKSGHGYVLSGVLSNAIKVNGKNYVVLFNVRDPAKPGTNLTGLYELSDGELKEIFVQETSFSAYYSDSHPASGVYAPVLYSNTVESKGKIYFWAKKSSQYVQEFDMNLHYIDIEKKVLESVSLNDEELLTRMTRQPMPFPLYISPSPNGIYTHNLKREIVNFEFNQTTKIFREVKYYAPVNLHLFSFHTVLNFSYPNQIISYSTYNTNIEVLTLQSSTKKSPIGTVFYKKDQIYFIDNTKFEAHIYNGSSLNTKKFQFKEDFNEIKFWDFTPQSNSDFYLLGVHGEKKNGIEGGHLYAINKESFEHTKLKTFDAKFNSSPYGVSNSGGNRSLICVNGNEYSFTDFSPSNTAFFKDPQLGEWARLVHTFNAEAAVLNNGIEAFYYNFKTQTKISLQGSMYDVFGKGDKVFFRDKTDLYFINPTGIKTKVGSLGYGNSGQVEQIDDFLVYRKTDAVGLLNKNTGKYIAFNVPEDYGFSVRYLLMNGQHYLIGKTKILKLNMEKGGVQIINTPLKVIQNPSVYKNTILFHEGNPPDYFKSKVWSYDGSTLRVLTEEFNIKSNGHIALNSPVVFRDTETYNHKFWIPEKSKFYTYDSHDFSDNQYFHYISLVDDKHYFYSFNYKLRGYDLFVFDLSTEKFSSLSLEDSEPLFIRLFEKEFYYSSEKNIWKVENSGAEKYTELKPVRVFGTALFDFKNNLYVWAEDENGVAQMFKLTDNESKEDTLLSTENPAVNFSFYPNPTQDYLNVRSTSETENKYKITVFGTDGKVISEQHLELPQKLDLSNLKEGTYLINVRAGRENKTFRVVKN